MRTFKCSSFLGVEPLQDDVFQSYPLSHHLFIATKPAFDLCQPLSNRLDPKFSFAAHPHRLSKFLFCVYTATLDNNLLHETGNHGRTI